MKVMKDKLCSTLEQRIGLLTRIKHKVNSEKIELIADAIFTSKLRYAIAVYSTPKFEFNNMEQAMDPNISKLQFIQNDLLRMQAGHSRKDHTNMKTLRESKKLMSVNQISCYHVGIEMFNIIYNSSSQALQENMKIQERGSDLPLESRCFEKTQIFQEEQKTNCAIIKPVFGIFC